MAARGLPVFAPAGEGAAAMTVGSGIDPEINAAVHRWTAAIERAGAEGAADGVVEVVPAYASLLIHYDPRLTDFDSLRSAVLALAPEEGGGRSRVGRLVELPTAYGGRGWARPALRRRKRGDERGGSGGNPFVR